jgi:hypothetical protein
MSPEGSFSIRPDLERFRRGLVLMGRIRATIPKHNCAILDVLLGFHYGHATEDETRGDCR